MRMEDGKLLGEVSIGQFDMTLRRSNIAEINPESIKELAPMAGSSLFSPSLPKRTVRVRWTML